MYQKDQDQISGAIYISDVVSFTVLLDFHPALMQLTIKQAGGARCYIVSLALVNVFIKQDFPKRMQNLFFPENLSEFLQSSKTSLTLQIDPKCTDDC